MTLLDFLTSIKLYYWAGFLELRRFIRLLVWVVARRVLVCWNWLYGTSSAAGTRSTTGQARTGVGRWRWSWVALNNVNGARRSRVRKRSHLVAPARGAASRRSRRSKMEWACSSRGRQSRWSILRSSRGWTRGRSRRSCGIFWVLKVSMGKFERMLLPPLCFETVSKRLSFLNLRIMIAYKIVQNMNSSMLGTNQRARWSILDGKHA